VTKTDLGFLLALQNVNGLGPIRLKALLDHYPDFETAWNLDSATLHSIGLPKNVLVNFAAAQKTISPDQLIEKLEKDQINVVTIFDDEYPPLLKQIYDPPIILYCKGSFDFLNYAGIGVVGTRKMTGYGKIVTEQFSQALVEVGFVIVSGLAKGVDTAAHWTAVKNNGRTIAVLGGGVNKIYPYENNDLAKKIIAGGGVVMSEYPPEFESLPGNFPSRNRIISGLSVGILVTEAASDSGSLITARVALEQGREVFAIPGPVTSSLSKGPIELIREGGRVVYAPDEIIEELGLRSLPQKQINQQSLDKEERAILALLENESMHIDEICRSLQISSPSGMGILLKMEIAGLVRNLGGGVYSR
jgi:DNA processing protein